MNKSEVKRRAQIAAIDARLNALIFGIPVAAVAGLMAYGFAGALGIGSVGLLAASQVINAHRKIEEEKEAIAKDDRQTLLRYTAKPDREALREAYASSLEPEPTETPTPAPANQAAWSPVEFNREELLEGATGLIALGNSGSGKTTLMQYICQGLQTAPVLVLDPHHKPAENRWGPTMVIKDQDQIRQAMEWLLSLLDTGDERPLVVIADEYPSIRLAQKAVKSDVADRFIIRWGSEGRKYNKLLIAGSQSGNVKSLGLEGQGDFLENFTLIRLGKIAVKDAANRPNRDLYNWLCTTAYPLTIDSQDASLHPNLGQHPRVIKGASTVNLEPFNPPPLPPDIEAGVTHHITQPPPKPHHTGHHTSQPITSHHITQPICPDCGSVNTVSNGTAPNGDKRRKCKSCGATFSTPATPAEPIVWGV
jgi:hypothetical protein